MFQFSKKAQADAEEVQDLTEELRGFLPCRFGSELVSATEFDLPTLAVESILDDVRPALFPGSINADAKREAGASFGNDGTAARKSRPRKKSKAPRFD